MAVTNEGKWSRRDYKKLAAWAVAIAIATVLGNQVVLEVVVPPEEPSRLLVLIAWLFILGVPLIGGLVAGLLVGPKAGWREVANAAVLGAAVTALAVYVQWVSDSRTCQPARDGDCVTGYIAACFLIFMGACVPFGIGTASGRAWRRMIR